MAKRNEWIFVLIILFLIIVIPILVFFPREKSQAHSPWSSIKKSRNHLDHSAFFEKKFKKPQDVTKACLQCHDKQATDFMKTSHWNWLGEPVNVPGHKGKMKIGKKNLINNFCISIQGNWKSCNSCHAGYGWKDDNFDFKKKENVDCLICHDWTGTYVKGDYGNPKKSVNLLAVAKGVGYPKRENCGICHIYGGGGMGVKHGDLDQTLVNPSENVDIHMGKHNHLCIDCHKTKNHNISGKAYSVSVNHKGGISCIDCHEKVPHKDRRINAHLDSLACQTCHISTFAKRAPTKVDWDWSKAGNVFRKNDTHHYLKIKGEFIYQEDVIPEYYWFNLNSNRYLAGDKLDPNQITKLNMPLGSIRDSKAKIWPFKVHHAIQPYDKRFKYLLQPVTAGEGGYWHEFNWDKAFRLGEAVTGLKYSGSYGFTKTDMYWPLSHMISPKSKALQCCDCHGQGNNGKSRMNWKALGYDDDPADIGGRKYNKLLKKGGK